MEVRAVWTRFLVELDTAEEHPLWAGGALTLKEDFFVDDVIAKQQNPGQFLTLGGHMRERVFITTGTTVKLTSKDWRKNPSVEKLVVVKRHMGSNVIVTEEEELYNLDDYDFKVVETSVRKGERHEDPAFPALCPRPTVLVGDENFDLLAEKLKDASKDISMGCQVENKAVVKFVRSEEDKHFVESILLSNPPDIKLTPAECEEEVS